jgi:hypothetical protein
MLSAAIFGLPLTMACARAFEAPNSWLGWSRVCVSLGAVAIVMFARRRTFARRLFLAFLLEAASGIATFAYVDVPFVTGHAVAIASGVAAGYARLTHRDLRADVRALPIAP